MLMKPRFDEDNCEETFEIKKKTERVAGNRIRKLRKFGGMSLGFN